MGDSKNIKLLDELSNPCLEKKKEAIVLLEGALLKEVQTEIPLEQLLHAGVYCRAIKIPAGTLMTGAVHLYAHIEIMASGAVFVTTDNGESTFLEGFNITPAFVGKKRAFYAIEDTIWITFHAVGETGDLSCEDVSNQLTVKSFEELDNHRILMDNKDYQNFITERGFNEESFLALIQSDEDMVSLDLEDYSLLLKESNIQGSGLFTKSARKQGEIIAPARIEDKRTPVGRFTNHSLIPNCEFIFEGDNLNMSALFDIREGEELTVNYRQVEAYRISEGDL